MNPLRYVWEKGIASAFLTGLFVLLPVILTFLVIEWIITKLRGALGPGSFVGDLLTSGGTSLVGPGHQTIAFWLGLAIALLGVWALGVLVKARAKRQLTTWIDTLFSRVPLVKTIYKPVSQIVRMLNTDEGDEFKGMSVVMCRFGGKQGAEVLALLTSQEVYVVDGNRRRLVYLPTSPIPMSGGLVFVAEDAVSSVPGVEADDLMKIYFSMGALMPEEGQGGLPRAIENKLKGLKV
ncbi:hypothetical protein BMG03_20190 (plasmid) [Thioclava nitratireducens]|uniref:DUF502 domain-containing protein n=1 Tax=Thioclava nitratireducens TaxID=1915078 RepID=A0ABN4XG84_9RHOB|nr:DUF502 domain-containing protein [Thioclava nitratireducens]AQS50229.1 hypothetical protein BMG03_20190 [Thioclava nitratireducens]